MPAPSSTTELLHPDRLQRLAGGAFLRGERYAREGRVLELDLDLGRGRVRAVVAGRERYRVELVAEDGKLVHSCSCPSGARGDFCKHCVAVGLLAHGHRAGAETPAVDREPEAEAFAHDEALTRWLAEQGLSHLRRLSADVLLPLLDVPSRNSVGHLLGRHRLVDVATPQSLRRYSYALPVSAAMQQVLPLAARRFLEDERRALATARAELDARLMPPRHLGALFAHAQLRQLRERFPDAVPPVPLAALRLDGLQLVPQLPGFQYTGARRWLPEFRAGDGFVQPKVVLRLSSSRSSADCSCHAAQCLHALEAVDAVLEWLRRGEGEQFEAALAELARPQWERTLDALGAVLEESARDARVAQVTWRLRVHETLGVEVTPYVHRFTRRHKPSSGTRVSAARLLHEHRDALGPEDRRAAELCAHGGPTSRALLFALANHPRVFLESAPDRQVRVERAVVGLVAEDQAGTVVLAPGVDGAPLPSSLRPRLRRVGLEEPLYLWDEGAARLTVLDVPPELPGVLTVLGELGNEFPPESHPRLLEKLSRMSARVPVAMPRSVMGEAVPPRVDPVLRLELRHDRSMRLEVRVRPLAEGATFVPGEGPRDVHARVGARAVHAVRDFEAERAAAAALARKLPLTLGEPEEPSGYSFPNPQVALELLAAAEALDPRPELEWAGAPLRMVGAARPDALRVVLNRRRDWFGALGGLSVEGERVELAVVLDAVRRGQRFVRVKGDDWVLLADGLRERLTRLADHAHVTSHGVEVGPAAAEAIGALSDAGATVDADQAWHKLAERIFAARDLRPKLPASLKANLRDYQADGFRWLTRLASWGAGGVLADDMGLGKTVQALAVLLDRAKLGPALVLAPTSVGFNWMDEAARFAPSLRMRLYAETLDRGGALARLGPRDVLVLSYGLLTRDIDRLSQVRFATVVFDEAQALKNATTQRTRAARLLQGDFRFALSGTPVENHLGELWSLYRIVFPGLLGSWESFRSRFAFPIEKRIDPTAAPALARVLQPFLLRRTKDQVAKELPPRTDIRVPVALSAEEWQLYEDARLAALSELETRRSKLKEQQRRVQVLAALTRLRMLASHPRLYDAHTTVPSSKLQRLLELVEELTAEGHRALVFSQFTSHLALVREALEERGLEYVYLDGQTPRKERERRVRAFQEGSAPLFLLSLTAGGFGLNLTGADNVVLLDPWWNPAVEDQASDRAHRIGQHRKVTVYRLVARGTIEEQILSLHEDKRELVRGVLDGQDQAGRLSTHELLGLLFQRTVPPEVEAEAKVATRH